MLKSNFLLKNNLTKFILSMNRWRVTSLMLKTSKSRSKDRLKRQKIVEKMKEDAFWIVNRQSLRIRGKSMLQKCLMMLRDSNNFKPKKSKRERISKEPYKKLCRNMRQIWALNRSSIARRWNTNRHRSMNNKKILTRLSIEMNSQSNRLKLTGLLNSVTLRKRMKRMFHKLRIWLLRAKLNTNLCRTDFMISSKKMRRRRISAVSSTILLKSKRLSFYLIELKLMSLLSKSKRKIELLETGNRKFITSKRKHRNLKSSNLYLIIKSKSWRKTSPLKK